MKYAELKKIVPDGDRYRTGDGAYQWVQIGQGCDIHDTVEIEDKVVIENAAVIQPGVSIGYGSHIERNVHIDAEVKIGRDATVGEGSTLGYACRIGDATSIGNNCSLESACDMGKWARIMQHVRMANWTSLGESVLIYSHASIGRYASIGTSSTVGMRAQIRERVLIKENVSIGLNAYIGNDCVLPHNVTVADGTTIPDYTRPGPYAVFDQKRTPDWWNEHNISLLPEVGIYWKWVRKGCYSSMGWGAASVVEYPIGGTVTEPVAVKSPIQCDVGLHVFHPGRWPDCAGLTQDLTNLACLEVEVRREDVCYGGLPGNQDKLRVKSLRVIREIDPYKP